MGAHALLSPSSASRWLACTPSARLEDRYPDKSSEAADEGTHAHSLAELELRKRFQRIDYFEYLAELEVLKASRFHGHEVVNYVADYVDYVEEIFNGFGPGAQIFFEVRLDLSTYLPEAFGTGDVVIVFDCVAHLIDLKYGKGVAVTAVANRQLQVYALGVIHHFGLIYGFTLIRVTIYQPRLDSVTTDELDASILERWADSYLRPRAALAFEGAGEFAVGEHCRFCRAAGQCRALAEANLALTSADFEMLTKEETSDVLRAADRIRGWLTAVESHALRTALGGMVWPGWKIVEGRAIRTWTSKPGAIALMKVHGFRDDQIYEPAKVVSPAKFEKLVGKKAAKELAPLIHKPPGKPALVPDTDGRPTYAPAWTDFAEYAELDSEEDEDG